MKFQLETLEYQKQAIQSVVKVFDGNERNTFDNANREGIRFNYCSLTPEQLTSNIRAIVADNGIDIETAKLSTAQDFAAGKGFDLCIEMETGTGKTLVYIQTIYELCKRYNFTKFIILVPSIAIRQGTLGTFKLFEKKLEQIYSFKVDVFEYDSKKLTKVSSFIGDQHPKVMIMTSGAFSSDDRILNRTQREDLFNNLPYIDAIAHVRPIVFMDEPQEGMDSDNMSERLKTLSAAERKQYYEKQEQERKIFKTLDPLFKIRYSATHKLFKNLLYRLTPYDSYKQGLVKKIEVLTVTEKNDEATLKIELAQAENKGGELHIKLKVWKQKAGKYVFEETNWLKKGDDLSKKTNNPSYLGYKIEHIKKSLTNNLWSVVFSNGTEIFEKQLSGNPEHIWALQLKWLIRRHFEKRLKLKEKGIKVLSLIFIDRVSNYMGEDPKIKKLFAEQYRTVYQEFNKHQLPNDQEIQAVQGYYFAQNAKGEFSDNEGGLKEQKRIYELILQKKEELLDIDNPIQFVFSHSALGVGWDNPNVFNIATLNTAYSDIRKRQEIGRGLRICVNQQGQRVYDDLHTNDDNLINQLSVLPNETYETFARQYQQEIKEVYGNAAAGANLLHTHKGIEQNKLTFRLNTQETVLQAFKRFWKAIAQKTDYTVAFDEESLIRTASEQLQKIYIPDYAAEVSSQQIIDFHADRIETRFQGNEIYNLKGKFAAIDLWEQISENTGLSYHTIFEIVRKISNLDQILKNPPIYVQEATTIIKNIALNEMMRGLTYHLTGENFPFDFADFVRHAPKSNYVETPYKGVFDKMMVDSQVEYDFARTLDAQTDIVCFLKLPNWYKIKTPIGDYEPDFGIVMKRKAISNGNESEFYFVVETKATDDINDKKALSESEVYKMKCAMKHFETLGIEIKYVAPVKTYEHFKKYK